MNQINILYLENNRFLVDQVIMRLEWKGYQVAGINNEQQLYSKIKQQSYDLLIIDFLTPDSNTFTLLNRYKVENILPPTIVVNDSENCQLISQVMQLGCLDFVLKDSLVHSYLDRLSLSIFKLFDPQMDFQRKPSLKPLPQVLEAKNDTAKSWQFFPLQNKVQWVPPSSTVELTERYDDFTAKIHLEDLALVRTQNNICLFSQAPVEYSFRYLSNDNQLITFFIHLKTEVNHLNAVTRVYGQLKILATEKLSDQNLRLKLSFLENTDDAVFISNANKIIVSANSAFTKISGYSEQEIVTQKTDIFNTKEFDADFYKQVARQLKDNCFWQGDVMIRHQNGHEIPVWQSTSIIKDSAGKISQAITVLRDISRQKAYEESIKFQANYDPLTQLPNRTLFLDRLNNALKLAERNQSKLALLLIDLDKFKWINDSMGHHAGDILLQATARKLKQSVRSSDTVARLGGDEFSVIVPELDKEVDVERIVSKIFKAFKQAIIIDQQEVFIAGSVGITIFPEDGDNIETLQQNADSAMYKAKKNGRNKYYYFTRAIQYETEKRLKLIDDMQNALLKQQFSLHYQPILDLETKKLVCAETLLRWNHPKTGYIPLEDFIPVAEESGMIREIGNWVIAEVASNIQRWSTLGFAHPQISLNQSVAQYHLSDCHTEWLEILKNRNIVTKNITFEISEKIFFEDKAHCINSIEELQKQGVKISLDGFGTGYSSLNHLKQMPIDVIKIDRSYIHNMMDDPTTSVLVETILLLAEKLDIKVIATGVENQGQMDRLKQKCRYAQGYYFSKPLPLNEFEDYMHLHS